MFGAVDLARCERRESSQNGEDGVIAAMCPEPGYFVEFGCDDAVECNCAALLRRRWRGLLMDGAGCSWNRRAKVEKEFVTAENVEELFAKHAVPRRFDFLSIDIDGNDYWVWKALVGWRPRVVCIEYNSHYGCEEALSIRYNSAHVWRWTDYYGATLKALADLGAAKGYTLVYCDAAGCNAFFAEDPAPFVRRSLEELWRPPNFDGRGARHPKDWRRLEAV